MHVPIIAAPEEEHTSVSALYDQMAFRNPVLEGVPAMAFLVVPLRSSPYPLGPSPFHRALRPINVPSIIEVPAERNRTAPYRTR